MRSKKASLGTRLYELVLNGWGDRIRACDKDSRDEEVG
tara:strand:- start:195 stop:308 length:114 start_codon:yes stop_codon:yes gene_type:complete